MTKNFIHCLCSYSKIPSISALDIPYGCINCVNGNLVDSNSLLEISYRKVTKSQKRNEIFHTIFHESFTRFFTRVSAVFIPSHFVTLKDNHNKINEELENSQSKIKML